MVPYDPSVRVLTSSRDTFLYVLEVLNDDSTFFSISCSSCRPEETPPSYRCTWSRRVRGGLRQSGKEREVWRVGVHRDGE